MNRSLVNGLGAPIALWMAGVLGCSEDPMAAESVEMELCEHMREGPIQAVAAARTSTSSLPNVAFEHARVDISLPEGSAGFVQFEAVQTAEYVFALGQTVGLAVYGVTGELVRAETEIVGAMACSEVARQYYFDFEVGPYVLEIGPSAASSTIVRLVSEALGEHTHEEHAD